MAILRLKGVMNLTGHKSHATIYNHIKVGLFTKPVVIGFRSVGWPDYEVDAIISARIAGQGEALIRDLVDRLHEKRTALACL